LRSCAQEVVRILRSDCGARLHWGKAGWPQWAACFDGAREYPDTWCHFGCAVQARDELLSSHRRLSEHWRPRRYLMAPASLDRTPYTVSNCLPAVTTVLLMLKWPDPRVRLHTAARAK